MVISVLHTAACTLHAHSRCDGKFDKTDHSCDVYVCPNGVRHFKLCSKSRQRWARQLLRQKARSGGGIRSALMLCGLLQRNFILKQASHWCERNPTRFLDHYTQLAGQVCSCLRCVNLRAADRLPWAYEEELFRKLRSQQLCLGNTDPVVS